MNEQAIRDGALDWFLRAEQTGYMEQLWREQVAPALADARIITLERELAAATARAEKAEAAHDEARAALREAMDWCRPINESGMEWKRWRKAAGLEDT